jgi:hypothetical protein
VLAAAAGITALPADVAAWVTPTLAFASALVTGLTAAIQPTKQADDHCRRAAAYDILVADVRMFGALAAYETRGDVEKRFKDIEERYMKLSGSVEA